MKDRSATAAPEMAEPSDSDSFIPPSNQQASTPAATLRSQQSTSSIPTPRKVSSSQTSSATHSPKPSREASPIRPPPKTNTSNRTGGRSRKNSVQDLSPTRITGATAPNQSSAGAPHNALYTTNAPQIPPSSSEPSIKSPTPRKPSVTSDSRDVPRWPISPRLRSPPPVIKPLTTLRKSEQDLPGIHVQRATPISEAPLLGTEAEDSSVVGMRTPARGVSGAASTLETVQEISQPGTPAVGLDGSRETSQVGLQQILEQGNPMNHAFTKTLKSKAGTGATESGSESGGNKSESMMRSKSVVPTSSIVPSSTGPPAKSYSTSSAGGRGKPSGEGLTKNMTVETETVSSIPQVAVGGGAGATGNNGSLRAKPSSETIRPKKDKKKTARKPPSVTSGTGEHPDSFCSCRIHHRSPTSLSEFASFTSPIRSDSASLSSTHSRGGTESSQKHSALRRPSLGLYSVGAMLIRQSRVASSKADIFEAKIANAVDEANSSDSEETFVYESNPPETNERPRRFHSRTPSATSMASQVDQRGNPRLIHAVMDGVHGVVMKKSMKFANSYNTNGPENGAGEDDGKGTARSNMGTGRGTTHHHHIGRWGRNGGNGHPSLFDNESPFSNAAKSKPRDNGSRNSSRPSSPRVSNTKMANGKKSSPVPSGYEVDDGAGADDERTPLMGSNMRGNRSGRGRRQPFSTIRQLEHQESRPPPSFLNRFVGCLVLSIMILLVVSGAIGFMFATTQPLTEVKVLGLKHILASEQTLILDMEVQARNPNIVGITVEAMDVEIFAKSKHIGPDSEYWQRPQLSSHVEKRRRALSDVHTLDDDPNDPYDDPDETQTMLLGSVYYFDSPLLFEGSPFKHTLSNDSGEFRLADPGNTTVVNGTQRWEKILKYDFELIVKGVLMYQLPMSQRTRRVSIDARATVTPDQKDKILPGEEENFHIL